MCDVDPIETFNRYGVGRRGARIVIMGLRAELSKDEALNLAAWLVALAEEHDGEFAGLLEAVRNT